MPGVKETYANQQGTLLAVALAANANRQAVEQQILKTFLKFNAKPKLLTGEAFQRALKEEAWRPGKRIAELSSLEFRSLAIAAIRRFSQRERIGPDVTEKLVRIAEQEWSKLVEPEINKASKPASRIDWHRLRLRHAEVVAEQAGELLNPPQVKRLKETLSARAAPRRKSR